MLTLCWFVFDRWCKNGSPLGFPRCSTPVERVSIFVVELNKVQSLFKAIAKESKITLISPLKKQRGEYHIQFLFFLANNPILLFPDLRAHNTRSLKAVSPPNKN